jgi:hypothetical protein
MSIRRPSKDSTFGYVHPRLRTLVVSEYQQCMSKSKSDAQRYSLRRGLDSFESFLSSAAVTKLDLDDGVQLQANFHSWEANLESALNGKSWKSVRRDYRTAYSFFKHLHEIGFAAEFIVAPSTWGPKERLSRKTARCSLPKNLQDIYQLIQDKTLAHKLVQHLQSSVTDLPKTSHVTAVRALKNFIQVSSKEYPADGRMFCSELFYSWRENYLKRDGVLQQTLDVSVTLFAKLLDELMDAQIIPRFLLPKFGRKNYVEWAVLFSDELLLLRVSAALDEYQTNSAKSTFSRRRRAFVSFLNHVRDSGQYLDPSNGYQLEFQWASWREWFYRSRGSDKKSVSLCSRDSDYRAGVQIMKWLIARGVFDSFSMPSGSKKIQKAAVALKERENSLSIHNLRPKSEKNNALWNPENLLLTESEYLDFYQKDLDQVVNDFRRAAVEEVKKGIRDFKHGQILIETCDIGELRRHISKSTTTSDSAHPDRISLFSPQHPNGLQNLISWAHFQNEGQIANRAFVGESAAYQHGGMDFIRRHLGLTGSVAMALSIVITCDLAINVDALRKFTVGTNAIESILKPTENPNAFTVTWDKPRAGKQIWKDIASLDCGNISAHTCFELAFFMTENMRRNSKSNSLWLHSISDKDRGPQPISEGFFKSEFHRFIDRNEILTQYKMRGPTLAKLRTSAGLLKWLETGGDYFESKRTLGNTTRVTIKSYVPQELANFMYRRQIRRFQNIMIIAAVAEAPLVARALNLTLEQLDTTLKAMRGNPELSGSEWLRRLDGPVADNESSSSRCIFLLSPENVALLRLFCDRLKKDRSTGVLRGAEVEVSGLRLQAWIDLDAILAQLLPAHESRTFRRLYQQGIVLADSWAEGIVFPALDEIGDKPL